jgi:hypothetical protein
MGNAIAVPRPRKKVRRGICQDLFIGMIDEFSARKLQKQSAIAGHLNLFGFDG